MDNSVLPKRRSASQNAVTQRWRRISTVVEGEAQAIAEYEHALEVDLAAEMRQAIELQLVSIKTSHKLAVALLTQSQAMKRST